MARLRSRYLTPVRRRMSRWIGRAATWHQRRPLLIFTLSLAALFLVDLFDSFGLDEASERAWADIIDNIYGPAYGIWTARATRDKIAVVLIDQRTLSENGQDGLPLGYSAQAQVLRKVGEAAPSAIFWDVYYPRARAARSTVSRFGARLGNMVSATDPGVDDLARAMREVSADRPLFVGPIARDSPPIAPLRALLDNNASLPITRGVHEVGLDVDTTTSRRYESSIEVRKFPDGTPQRLSSAAVALYAAYCAARPVGDCPSGRALPAGRSMLVQWGFGVSEWRAAQLDPDRQSVCGEQDGLWRWLHYFGRGMFRQLYPARDDRRIGERCGYHDIVPAADLANYHVSGAKLADRLKGRIVLVGFDIATSSDRRIVPFYGEVPGVLIHAMALDNLIQKHGRPAMIPDSLWLGIDQLDVLQYLGTIIAVLTALILSGRVRRLFLVRETRRDRRFLLIGMMVPAALTIWVTGAFLAGANNWPLSAILFGGILPGGVFGIGLVILARSGIEKGADE